MNLLAKFFKTLCFFTIITIVVLPQLSLADQEKLTDRADVQLFIKQTAKKYGFTEYYLAHMLNQAQFTPEVITKMKHPTEAKPWSYYHDFFIRPERIADGVSFYHDHQAVLDEVSKTYGVPANIIVAIIGVETRYGQVMGKYRVIDSLTTLAFNPSPRATFFRTELAKFFVLARESKLDPLTIYGSRSGAIGLCQFMPSSYLYYGISYKDPKKLPDLFNNADDAIVSTAHFLRENHWQPDQPVTSPAAVMGKDYMTLLKRNSRILQQPKITVATFMAHHVIPAGIYNPDDRAYLIGLLGNDGVQYWLGFENFYVLTHYNNSDLYAMAVYQFAQAIEAARQPE